MNSTIEVIHHCQRRIRSCKCNEDVILECINELTELPVEAVHLDKTGIHKTVDDLKGFRGKIGVAAEALIAKWKTMALESNSEVAEVIEYYRENIYSAYGSNDKRGALLRCLNKLNKLPIKVAQLKETPICRTVGCLKIEGGDVGAAAELLVKKWNAILADAEIKPMGSTPKKKDKKYGFNETSQAYEHNKQKYNKIYRSGNNIIDNKRLVSVSLTESAEKCVSKRKRKSDDKVNRKEKIDHKFKRDKNKHRLQIKGNEGYEKLVRVSGFEEHLRYDRSLFPPLPSKDTTAAKDSSKEPNSTKRKRRHTFDNNYIDFKYSKPKEADLFNSSSPRPKKKYTSSMETFGKKAANARRFSLKGSNLAEAMGDNNLSIKKCNQCNDTEKSITSSCTIRPALYSTSSGTEIRSWKPSLQAVTTEMQAPSSNVTLESQNVSNQPLSPNQSAMNPVPNKPSFLSKPVHVLNDVEAINYAVSCKKGRTKVFSGTRPQRTFHVPSLSDLCVGILHNKIDSIKYIGDIPFRFLKPFLERATPQQLNILEKRNAWILNETDALWEQHSLRKYPTKQRLENESWRRMFFRCKEEEQQKLEVIKSSIKATSVRQAQLSFLNEQERSSAKTELSSPTDGKINGQQSKRKQTQLSSSSIRRKKAPLMKKALKFIRCLQKS